LTFIKNQPFQIGQKISDCKD